MDQHQERVLQSYRRVLGWFEANREYVGPALGKQIEALVGVVDRVTAHAAEQQTQASQSLLISKDERELRRELLSHHMGTIARLARALRGTVPGIGVLSMPKGNIQSAALITAATVMARKADVYQSVMVEQGLPTDFVRQLEGCAASLKRSLDARGLARGARTAASRGVSTELSLGRRIVDAMDAALERVLRKEPVKWTEWRNVKRVVQKGVVVREIPTAVEASPKLVEGAPTAPAGSPTEVVGSPIVKEKAA